MNKGLKLTLKITFWFIVSIAVLLLGVFAFDRIAFASFYSKAENVMAMPGISDGLVQQGLEYDAENKVFILAGYMANNSSSRIYIVDESGTSRYVQLKNANGSDYKGHTGGVTFYNGYLYVTGADGLDVFSYIEILNGAESVKQLGVIKTFNDPAYCHKQDGYLYVGSFHLDGTSYINPEHEFMTTPSGDENKAVVTVFKLDSSKDFGVDPIPRAVLSTREKVQGMCFVNDKIVLSTSYSLAKSVLYVYDTSKITYVNDYTYKGQLDGVEFEYNNISCYFLDSTSLVNEIVAPPMCEEIVYKDGKIYIANESASNKYIFGKFTSGNNLYAYKIG